MEAPIYSRLKKYFDSDKISFAMPGHKNGRGLNGDLLCCDVTELDSTLNLFPMMKRSLRQTLSSLLSTAAIKAIYLPAAPPSEYKRCLRLYFRPAILCLQLRTAI